MSRQDKLVKLFSVLSWRIANSEFRFLGSYLKMVAEDPILEPVFKIAAFRACFCARRKIPNWENLVQQSIQELNSRQLDGNGLMRGLQKP